MTKIPVVILTGFLGVGKTTLLKRALENSGGRRVALIVNEFGDVGIDGELLKGVADNIVELPGGALCCASAGDTHQALASLMSLAKEPIEHVVIETTGLADPLPLAKSLLSSPSFTTHYRFAGVITLVDAKFGLTRTSYPEWQAQVRGAQLLVVTKTDLTEGAIPEVLETQLRSLNESALIVADADLFSFSEQERAMAWVEHSTTTHAHSTGITSTVLTASQPLDQEKIARFIGEHFVLNGDRLLRYKGIFWLHGFEERFVFQGGGYEFETVPDRPWETSEVRESTLVVIGHGVTKSEFEQAFLGCQVG